MGPEIVAPVGGMLMVVAIILVTVGGPLYFRSKEKAEMQKTVRHALDKGQALPPEMVAVLAKSSARRRSTAQTDLRTGVIWLAVGLGIGAFGYMIGLDERDALNPVIGMAAVPTFIGLAFIILSFFNKTKSLED